MLMSFDSFALEVKGIKGVMIVYESAKAADEVP